MKKVLLKVGINTLLGIILIFIWSRFVNLFQIVSILKTIKIVYLLSFFVLTIFSSILRSLRFKLLISIPKITLKDLVMLNFMSQFLSFMIPIRAGEISKGVYLSSEFSLPLTKTLVWVFIDRFLDFWTVLFLILIILLLNHTIVPLKVILVILLIFVGFTVMSFFIVYHQHVGRKIIYNFSSIFIFESIKSHFITFSDSIISGFEVLHYSFTKLSLLILISIFAFISDGIVWFAIFLSLKENFGIINSILANLFLSLTFLIPSSPGYIGTAEASGLIVFSGILKLNTNLASAGTVLFHVLNLILLPILGISAIYFLKFNLELVWKRLIKKEKSNFN